MSTAQVRGPIQRLLEDNVMRVRPHTTRIMTGLCQFLRRRKWAVKIFIHKTSNASIRMFPALICNLNDGIDTTLHVSCPLPTSRAFMNVLPDSFHNMLLCLGISKSLLFKTRSRTILSSFILFLRRMNAKGFLTIVTRMKSITRSCKCIMNFMMTIGTQEDETIRVSKYFLQRGCASFS